MAPFSSRFITSSRPLSHLSTGGRGSGLVGAGLAVCWVGTDLGWLEAEEELERLGRKCHIAWDDFWASVKRSVKPSTAGPNRLPDEIGASRKGILSASFISVIVSQRWHSNTMTMDIERPIAWAVAFVACRVRSVALLGFLSEAESRPASSLASILAWKTWSTAIECSAEAACPAAE